MAKFILRIPDSYAPRFTSNIVEIDADNERAAKARAYSLLNIPAVLLSVTPKADESKALQDAATKIENLQTTSGENVFTYTSPFTSTSTGFPGINIPKAPESGISSELGGATQALNQYNLNRQLAGLYALGEGETASLTPEQSRVVSPTVRPPSYFGGETEDLLRLDELESEMFARLARGASVPADLAAEINRLRAGQGYEEGSLAYGLFRDSGDSGKPKDPEDPGDSGDSGDSGDPGPSDAIPANLPEFWRERYDEYLLLSPELQRLIIENQIKDYIELQPYRTIATEEGGGVSGAAGADVGLEELQGILGQTPGATVNPDGSISFVPGTVDPSTIDVTRRIPDPLQLQGYANTGLQDILNIFYANPDRYISEIPLFEDVYDPVTGQVTGQRQVGTQQVLSPVAQAALQAFSTQRGAESADIASRYGTASPFGVIAGAGGETAAEKAIELANLQAKAGITNPFAALGIGSAIGDISTILRGGITAEQQQQQQLLSALSPLLQASPGTLGGLSRVLGGEEQLRNLFSPFTSPAVQPVTDQGAPIQVSQQPFAPIQRTGEYIDPRQPMVERVGDFDRQAPRPPVIAAPQPGFEFATQTPRQTVGGYQRADLFDRGGIKAEAGMAGEELDRYLGQVTPFGGGSPRGSLGAIYA